MCVLEMFDRFQQIDDLILHNLQCLEIKRNSFIEMFQFEKIYASSNWIKCPVLYKTIEDLILPLSSHEVTFREKISGSHLGEFLKFY